MTPHISLLGAGQTLKQMVANLVMDIVNAQGLFYKQDLICMDYVAAQKYLYKDVAFV